MSWTELHEGSATIGTTEYSIVNGSTTPASSTTKLTAQIWLDVNAMELGDEFAFRLYEKVRSSGTQRLVEELILTGPQTRNVAFPSVAVGNGWDFRIAKLAGTDRAIAWSVRQY